MSFDMLTKLPDLCPDELWYEKRNGVSFWQYIYHTLSGVHYWMRLKKSDLRDPFPGKKLYPDFEDEPEQALTNQEIKNYCDTVKKSCEDYFKTIKDTMLIKKSVLSGSFTNLDVILLMIRHIQYHVGQCNSMLKEKRLKTVAWIE